MKSDQSGYTLLLQRLSFVTLICFLLSGILIPIYTDEIGWRIQERSGFDGYDSGFSDFCGPNINATPPLLMMPVRYVSYALGVLFPDPIFIRLFGVFNAILWVFLYIKFLNISVHNKEDKNILSHLSYNLLSLGLLPALFIWSRPEQPLNLTILMVLILFEIVSKRSETTKRLPVIFSFGIASIIFIINLSYHPKSILLSPIFLLIFYFLINRMSSVFTRIVATSFLASVFIPAYFYWTTRFQCPNDPILAQELGKMHLVSAASQAPDLASLVKIFLSGDSFVKYFVHLGFAHPESTMSTWIFSENLPYLISIASRIIVCVTWVSILYFVIIHCAISFLKLKILSPMPIRMALAIAVSIVCISATQLVKNAYEITLIAPLILFLFVYVNKYLSISISIKLIFRKLNNVLSVLVLLNFATYTGYYVPRLIKTTETSGYITDQPYSQSVFNFDETVQKIQQVAASCGIYNNSTSRHVLVDDVTYLALIRTFNPFHFHGVIGPWNGSITDPMSYLRSRGSQGIVLSCRNLPDPLRVVAREEGEFCCLPID